MTRAVVATPGPADIDPIAGLHAACFDAPWSAPTLRRILAMPGAFGLAARAAPGGAIVGFALARIGADECELLSLGVAPGQRRKGVGASLLDATMACAAARSARALFLEVAETNRAALRLYRGRGFVPVGRRPDYYEPARGPREAAVTMRCDLPAMRSAG